MPGFRLYYYLAAVVCLKLLLFRFVLEFTLTSTKNSQAIKPVQITCQVKYDTERICTMDFRKKVGVLCTYLYGLLLSS